MSQQSFISSLSNFSLVDGVIHPFGATLSQSGCNFSIYAPDAEAVYVCLFDDKEKPLAQIALHQRVQSKWFGFINNVTKEHCYGIRIQPKKNRLTHPDSSVSKLLIDPYAKALNRPLNWSAAAYEGDSCTMVPKAYIVESVEHKLSPLNIKPQNRVIYEAHIKGLTQLNKKVPEHLRGTYLGACEPSVIEHFKSLGITSIQFLPLMAFMPEPFATQKGLTNYWGYNPINFFAAEPRYASKNASKNAVNDAVSECKKMISVYRDAGIEIILDVVFNHTCESGQDGPVLSFRGLCESHAYLQEQNDEHDCPQYVNYSGCGNTIKVSDTYMTNLLIDALRYWVSEMGVSGFRFDLASVLGREVFEFKNTASFFKILRQDPVLKHAVMLAEPWDIGPGGYQLGQYPDYWLEVNDKYRDVVRGFWRGDKGLKGQFATRLMGSRDVFRKNVRPMHSSVNNVTYHDGFTLHDIVSYQEKHNLANLEDNRDGHNHNLTANYGVEGETSDSAIIALREQQKRNLFATLIVSQGTPHILGGDELSRSQKGNNNAYCQDNELNWYDWDLSATQLAFLEFCQYVIKLRQSNSLLQKMSFADDLFDNQQNIQVADWYRRDGTHKTDIDWVNHEHHCFALHVIGENDHNESEEWLFCVNSKFEDREFNLPLLSPDLNSEKTSSWVCVLDTSMNQVNDSFKRKVVALFDVPAHSFLIFKKA